MTQEGGAGGELGALTEHAAVVKVHVATLRADLDGIQQVVRTQQAGRSHYVQHLCQSHEGQPHCCHHFLGVSPFHVLPAPATQGQEDLLLRGSK